ncbi:MAG: DUF4168 domain-containing protein [Marinoscillum sp.]
MKYLKSINIWAFSLVFVLCGTQVMSQETQQADQDFSDDEYDQFVKINVEIIPVQQEAQGEMMEAITGEGMEVDRFQELAQAQQQGKLADTAEGTDELAKFNKAGQKVMQTQKDVQLEIQKAINENGMSVQQFQQFSMAYQQDPEVKARVDKLIAEEIN